MSTEAAPLRFHLDSLLKDSSGQFRPVGINPDGKDTLPVRLGYKSVWESTFKEGPCRGQFYFSINPYFVENKDSKVTAIRSLDPNFFWFSTIRGKIPGKELWAATYELPKSNLVWTVDNSNSLNPEIVLKPLNYVEPGKISDDQLFILDTKV